MAGRTLRGLVRRVATGYQVEVPAERGSKKRVKVTFADEATAEDWKAAAVEALLAGQPLPGRSKRAPAVVTSEIPEGLAAVETSIGAGACGSCRASLIDVVDDWLAEYYDYLENGGPGRREQVRAHFDIHWLPFAEANGFCCGCQFTRATVRDHLIQMTRPDRSAVDRGAPEYQAIYTIDEAVQHTPASRSTIKRRLKDGTLRSAGKDARGRILIERAALVAAELMEPLRRGPKTGNGHSKDTVADRRWALEQVLIHGRETAGWKLQFDIAQLKKSKKKRKKRKRRHVTLAEVAAMARHFHAVHALAVWLCRVLGLRISEAFGIRLDDIVDLGDRGLIRIHRQGGKQFVTREDDGTETTSNQKDETKTESSVRALLVARQLMEVIRLAIDVFHRDDLGNARLDARLIPGLKVEGVSGQDAFRDALREAAKAEKIDIGIDVDELMLPRPHDMRAGAITDLAWSDVEPLIRKRVAGHAAGTDVHSVHYVLDHADVQKLLPATTAMELLIDEQIPDGLIIPSAKRCTTRSQSALEPRAAHIDAALIDAGWLIVAGATHPGGHMCDARAVAELRGGIDAGDSTVRRWMREHREAVVINGQRFVPLETVLADIRERESRVTLSLLADESGADYHHLRYLVTRHKLATDDVDGTIVLPDETVATLRELIAEQAALEKRAVSVPAAAEFLQASVSVVDGLIRVGRLDVDPIRGPRLSRYVTKESLEWFAGRSLCGGESSTGTMSEAQQAAR